jgi:hypothetical protein
VLNDGTTLTMSSPETEGTDYNPSSVTFTLVAANTYKNIRVDVVGQAATALYWRATFQLEGEWANHAV